MQVIYLIRHGETEFNRDGRVQGYTESPLSDLGVEQARRLRARLEGLAVDAAYTSPLSRAQETCRIAMDGRGWEARAGLREIGLGEWEGKRAADLRREFPDQVKMWFRSPGQVRIPGAETMADFRRRVTGELDSIRAAHPDGTVVVIAHGGVICAYLTSILGMQIDDIWRFKIRNCSLTRVLFPQDRARIDTLGDISHLDGELRELPDQRYRMLP
ncbi:MAG TPA: histidine phosphatase family protein [Chromatiales bacterium]|nr:histidine phosphatase family protein [Chromatiales bacterium]